VKADDFAKAEVDLSRMLTITAIIRAKKGQEETMRQALIKVAENVKLNEPDTVGFFISQDASDRCLFATYERFTDKAAMDRHNGSEAVARFFDVAKPILDGGVTLITASEISAKPAP
jgi:quinol monooxygenase YgiN